MKPEKPVPFVDRISKKVSIQEQIVDFKPQSITTKDNVTLEIDTRVYFQVTDAKLFTYGIEDPLVVMENLMAAALRDIIGEMEQKTVMTHYEMLNTQITSILNNAADKLGIKVNRAELKNITLP